MNSPPVYFESIRQHASERWEQLESDPELAGPWRQLFKQVQSPRHILSELLQNADDAGATEAAVCIENHSFIFTHNGEDFTAEHFASLCRFGYSNKRALHTIGFRGIGFKSTFSLGDTVELYTPTLTVAFHSKRFTEPKWINGSLNTTRLTQIRVAISDEHREREVEKNIEEWLSSPISLLFFRHIRCLRIGEHEMHWRSLGAGPVANTEWMALHDNTDEVFLLARSEPEAFPAESLAEIRQERLLDNQETDFPPCKVEIVLGSKGRLYVVLPTGVETKLPFACNAPFIQDPARLKIKDPETSPTNRWLLERLGKLAGSVMLQWLGQTSVALADRSRAYNLFPDVDRDDSSLEGTCAAIVEKAFDEAIDGQPFLLTDAGELRPTKQSVIFPKDLFDVWAAEQVVALLDSANRPAFSCYVSDTDCKKLLHWGVIEEVNKDDVLVALQSKQIPKPTNWRRLLKLWAYVAPELTGYRDHPNKKRIRIVPVQGKEILCAATEVIRLGEKKLLQSDADWEFLSPHIIVMNQNWLRFVAEQRRIAEKRDDNELSDDVEAVNAVLNNIGLSDASDLSTVIEQVASAYLKVEDIALADHVRLAQIAAKLGATIGESFRFVTQALRIRSSSEVLLLDKDGTLEHLLPADWCKAHLLHSDYSREFNSCSKEEWLKWISSGRSKLLTFAPLTQRQVNITDRQQMVKELQSRGKIQSTVEYIYEKLSISDRDFDNCHWDHWETLAREDERTWGNVVRKILDQPTQFFSNATEVTGSLEPYDGRRRHCNVSQLLPAWIVKLRDLPCLPDTYGLLRKPSELLRRTPATESLLGVEPFIDGYFDTESSRSLLKLLGVRDTPPGPDRLLDCLRSLAKAEQPPVLEVDKWYHRLDQMAATCSTENIAVIRKAFCEEKLILTESSGWASTSGAFLSTDEEDVPGMAIVRSTVRDLSLWRRIGIAERPTLDLAMQWLHDLPSGERLSHEDFRRVRSLFRRYAVNIWSECGHWLNLAGEWTPVQNLEYGLTMQSLTSWSHLLEWVKQKTADLQNLTVEITSKLPFSCLPHLAGQIEDRFHHSPLSSGHPERKPWLNQLGMELRRIELNDDADTERIRALADELADTTWQVTPGLHVIPYINGTPAGTPKRAEVVWFNRVLYVDNLSNAKLARLVPRELGSKIGKPEITAALNYCYGRTAEEVIEYIEENFNLAPRELARPALPESENEADELSPTADDASVSEHPADTLTDETEISIIDSGGEKIAGDENNEQHEERGNRDEARQKAFRPPRPPSPSIMERFAEAKGYRKTADDRFYHPDGNCIIRSYGNRFPWVELSSAGEEKQYYLPKELCLESRALELDADIWGLMGTFPDKYVLVLSTPDGGPLELTGERLVLMQKEGRLKLYPATYRLVYERQ